MLNEQAEKVETCVRDIIGGIQLISIAMGDESRVRWEKDLSAAFVFGKWLSIALKAGLRREETMDEAQRWAQRTLKLIEGIIEDEEQRWSSEAG